MFGQRLPDRHANLCATIWLDLAKQTTPYYMSRMTSYVYSCWCKSPQATRCLRHIINWPFRLPLSLLSPRNIVDIDLCVSVYPPGNGIRPSIRLSVCPMHLGIFGFKVEGQGHQGSQGQKLYLANYDNDNFVN